MHFHSSHSVLWLHDTPSKHHSCLTSLQKHSSYYTVLSTTSPSKLCSGITSCMKLPFNETTHVWFYLGKYILLGFHCWLICIFFLGFEVLSPKSLKGTNISFCFLPFHGVTSQKVYTQSMKWAKNWMVSPWVEKTLLQSSLDLTNLWVHRIIHTIVYEENCSMFFFPWLSRQETQQQCPNSMETPPMYWHHGNFA